jgi:short subunit fatty acids transporter
MAWRADRKANDQAPRATRIVKHLFGLLGGFFALWGFGFLYAAIFEPTVAWPDATWRVDAVIAVACWALTFAIWRRVLW